MKYVHQSRTSQPVNLSRIKLVGMAVLLTGLLIPFAITHAVSPNKIQFEGFLLPDAVIVDTTRDLTMCLVNQGTQNQVSQIGVDEDRLVMSIPAGAMGSDLATNGAGMGCTATTPGWECTITAQTTQIDITVNPPLGTEVTVNEDETVCFEITNMSVNTVPGLTFSSLEQFIDNARANKLIEIPLTVFKNEAGSIEHTDLTNVQPAQHHPKTDSFTELTDGLAVGQLPTDGYASTYVNEAGDTMTGSLTVNGLVESTVGGVKFPDGTMQATAQLVGPPGATGAPGPQGIEGIQGDPGPQGIQGLQGNQGNPGPVGPQGIQGVPGTNGSDGSAGADGTKWLAASGIPAGGLGVIGDFYLNTDDGEYFEKTDVTVWTSQGNLTGPQGVQGIQGNDGLQGVQGDPGPQAIQGLTGADGAPGAQGIQGDPGPQGIQGVAGTNGNDGAAGTDGTKWFADSGVPAGGVGVIGDLYLNTDNGEYFEKTDVALWTSQGNLTGPQGIQGNDGPQGSQGLQGDSGPQGVAGPVGLQGDQGPQGDQGLPGPQGLAGVNGIDGTNGVDGAPGPIGPQGPIGLTGPAGTDGAPGPVGPAGSQGLAGVNGIDGTNGDDGAQGPQGIPGPQGPAGSDAAACSITDNGNGTATLSCPSGGPTFTFALPTEVLLELFNVQDASVTSSSATITFVTSIPATAQITFTDLVASEVVGTVDEGGVFITSHSMVFSGFQSGGFYGFIIDAQSPGGQSIMSELRAFFTP